MTEEKKLNVEELKEKYENEEKYKKKEKWQQLAPYIMMGVGLLIFMLTLKFSQESYEMSLRATQGQLEKTSEQVDDLLANVNKLTNRNTGTGETTLEGQELKKNNPDGGG